MELNERQKIRKLKIQLYAALICCCKSVVASAFVAFMKLKADEWGRASRGGHKHVYIDYAPRGNSIQNTGQSMYRKCLTDKDRGGHRDSPSFWANCCKVYIGEYIFF